MRVSHHLLQGPQPLDANTLQPDCMHVLRGRGRGSRLHLPSGWMSACLVLSGELEMGNGETQWSLAQRQFQLWTDGPLRCFSRQSCWWIVVTSPPRFWDNAPHKTFPSRDALPWHGNCPRTIMRAMIQLARLHWHQDNHDSLAAEDIVSVMHSRIIEQQSELQMQLERCSGRTHVRRQQTLLRLLRVQHLIRCNLEDRIELSRLAASANYSPCHLLRIYREVFGETPCEYATRLRCQRALALVRKTNLSICEIAEMLGFESESAFCRAFKHAFGCTTSAIRHAPHQHLQMFTGETNQAAPPPALSQPASMAAV